MILLSKGGFIISRCLYPDWAGPRCLVLARMGTGKPPPTATVLCYDIMMAGVWRERIMQ